MRVTWTRFEPEYAYYALFEVELGVEIEKVQEEYPQVSERQSA